MKKEPKSFNVLKLIVKTLGRIFEDKGSRKGNDRSLILKSATVFMRSDFS